MSVDADSAALRAVLRAEEQLSAALQALDRGGTEAREAALTALRAAHGRLARTLQVLATDRLSSAATGSNATPQAPTGAVAPPSLTDLVRQTASELETVRASVRSFGEGLPATPPSAQPRPAVVAGILETRLGNVEDRLHGIEQRVRWLERVQLGLS